MADWEFDLKEEAMLEKIGKRYKDNVTVNKKYTKGNKVITEHAVDKERPVYGIVAGQDYRGQMKTREYTKTVTTYDKAGNVTGFEKIWTED